MDKKSFVKGLFSGLGISFAGLIVAGGVIACNQKPVTTTPIVNKAEVFEERGRFLDSPKKAFVSVNNYVSRNNPVYVTDYLQTSGNTWYVGSSSISYGGTTLSFSYIGITIQGGSVYRYNFYGSSTSIQVGVILFRSSSIYFLFDGHDYSSLSGLGVSFEEPLVLEGNPASIWDLVFVPDVYGLIGSSNNCSYVYSNNNDGTGYVDVTPDAGYYVDVNEWNDGTATYSGADYQRYESLGNDVYRLYFTDISVDGWSATFNAIPKSTQTITYNLSHCTATPLTLPYGDLDHYEYVRITPDEGYSLKHVTPSYTGLVDRQGIYDWIYYPQSDYIEIYANQVGVNPSVTCSAIERVDVNYDGLEHCSILDVSPSPLVGYESRWRFVPDDGYNFENGLTNPSWSVTPVASASWSKQDEAIDGKTILVCDATPNDGSMSFDIEASAGIPVTSVLDNLDGKPLAYTEDSPVYWVDDNVRRSVTYNAMRGYRFVPPYVRVNVNAGISYTLSNNDHTLVVEYWNVPTGAGVNQLTIYPQLNIDVEAMGWGSTNVNFGSSWRPIQYVDNTAEYYTGTYMESNVLDFDSIVFSANGSMYDGLKLVYKVIGSNKFFVDGVDLNADGHLSTFKYFDHMEYRNSVTGESVIACSTKAMIVTVNNETWVEVYPQELYWGNVQNGIISIYYDDGTTYDTATGVGLNLTATYILLNGGNVTGGSSIGNTGNVGFGGTYDPFVLISSAIGTATSFLGYMVLPGLNIGMLMLIPMIITLIIVVFKLVKK